MKRIGLLSFVLIAALSVALAAQAPAGAPQGAPGAGGGGRGGPGGGGGGRGGPGGGGRGGPPAAAAAPAALQAIADSIAAAINKQDAAALTKMLGMNALYLDEDGHAIPATVWAMRLTTGTPPKMFSIAANSTHGEMLDDNSAWLSFNFSLGETFQGSPKTITGTASLALQKTGADWMIQMIHGGLTQHVAGLTQ